MSKMLVSKSFVNIRMITNITALTTFILLTGCQTLPSTMSKTMQAPANNMSASNPLTARMSAIDRQGRIAYVEEQGVGAEKMSTLYSIRPDGSDRQLIDQLNGYIYAPAWSADGQLLAYSKQAPRQHPKIYIYDRKSNIRNLVVNAEGSNMSASFSPDGQKLLYSSTVGGNADIYEMRLSMVRPHSSLRYRARKYSQATPVMGKVLSIPVIKSALDVHVSIAITSRLLVPRRC